jgi:1,4-alpha-glucan branching enzyme
MRAAVAFVLHAHLPWVDPRDDDDTVEGRWLLEALTGSYLPLVDLLVRHEAEGLPARMTLSVTPTLLAQLAHPTLSGRYRRHLDRLDALLDGETKRLRGTAFAPLVSWHRHRVRRARASFFEELGGDVPAALASLWRQGRIEVAASAATHAVLSLIPPGSPSRAIQIRAGLAATRRALGRVPATFWLPECGYEPGLDGLLVAAGVERVVVDTHGVVLGTPRPVYGPYAPVASPAGLVVFPREPEGSMQVWSSTGGYPGDPWYADFHRDVGWSAAADARRAGFPLPPGGAPVGLRHHRVGEPGSEERPYEPAHALETAHAHARRFVADGAGRAASIARRIDRPPCLVYAFDAELFGHWWLEGPVWLDAVLRTIAGHPVLAAPTLEEALRMQPVLQQVQPAASTWGAGGHHETWLTATAWPHDALAALDAEIASIARGPHDPALLRVARGHHLLAQSSDWTFMMTRGASAGYGRRRLEQHLAASQRACEAIRRGTPLDEPDRIDDRLLPGDDLRDFP